MAASFLSVGTEPGLPLDAGWAFRRSDAGGVFVVG
jgi:hypothetical protein